MDEASLTTMVQTTEEGRFDVVVVGAGPAGLMAAMALVRMGIKPLVIDSGGLESHEYGRADALQPRFLEVMQTFGTPAEELEQMGKKIYGRAFWEISEQESRRIALARFFPRFLDFDKDYALAVRQGLIEQVMINDSEKHCHGFKIHWHWEFLTMELPSVHDALCTVTIRNVQTQELKIVTAKYVIAADGGKSSVRRWASQFGVKLDGESRPVTWCVLDAVGLKSDHPDLECLSVLRSKKGIVLVIPREPIHGKPSARFDVQLEKSRTDATQEDATRMIKEIFHPFTVEWDEVNWWSSYDVSQRLINKYSVSEKVFFVGDACHTHSPRAGLGLNTAVLEAHNLAWKIALVVQGHGSPKILTTYSLERQAVGLELVQMDRQLVELYAGLEQQSMLDFSSEAATDWLSRLHSFQAKNYAYQAGASIVYRPTPLSVSESSSEVLTIGRPGLTVGARLRPVIVTRLSDSVPVPALSKFDGRFTIYILVGDLERYNALQALIQLDTYIGGHNSTGSIFARFGGNMVTKDPSLCLNMRRRTASHKDTLHMKPLPKGKELYNYDYDDIAQITAEYRVPPHSLFRLAVVTSRSSTGNFVSNKLMSLLYPRTNSSLEHPPSRIFDPQYFYCDDIPALSPYRESAPDEGQVFEHPMHRKWDIKEDVGAIIVARPDGHVGLKTTGFNIGSWMQVEAYFEGFLRPIS